jgi:DNA mismatch repair protein MutS
MQRDSNKRGVKGAAGEPAAVGVSTSVETDKPPAGVTPSMAQFLEIKAANPDCLLFYRMGDFYELFFQDAVAAAQALGIVLTKRGKHLGEDIPMCGVPIHRADEYLQRLIRQGFRVAVCEQMEDPAEARKRGSKAVVRRDVVRLVTPGTLTEESLLDAKARNYLTAVFKVAKGGNQAPMALASLDISTGEFEVSEVPTLDFPGEIVRLSPGEVIASDALLADADIAKWVKIAGAAATPVAAASFDSMAGERLLKAQLQVGDLAAFGAFSRPELAAVGALLKYVELTQIGKRPCLRAPRRTGPSNRLVIDAPTRASLELLRSLSGERQTSLLGVIDRTVTGAGARELAARLASPLREPGAIAARLDAVGFLLKHELLRGLLRRRRISPAPCRVAFLAARRPARPGGSQRWTARGGGCVRLLTEATGGSACRRLGHVATRPGGLRGRPGGDAEASADRRAAAIASRRWIRQVGYRADLDEARGLRDDSRKVMASLKPAISRRPALSRSRLRHNNILGFYVEVPPARQSRC